ncbi:putative DNA replication pre-initiation complex subunit Cdc45 [Paratrimastix pyriformis]|uniref:DNA replication pre-initiation complex subunit Cdc45 n=1 Tax=Paratrimastix pyriformis TaxID=342808 RepID=A0ABQ8UK08_9EUKA|nr:putative DNA replication pre-initiation complex subunit Cdc45 [Paratrimastix pyriformis]
MLHSSYVASRLAVWKDSGQRRLMELLAKMGIPLQQCHQDYRAMDPTQRRRLPELLKQWAPKYGLPEASFESFQRTIGFHHCISAADAVFSATALLECPLDPVAALTSGGSAPSADVPLAAGAQGGIAAAGAGAEAAGGAKTEEAWQERFWRAFDALGNDHDGPAVLNEGLKLAIHLQKAIISVGGFLIQRKEIKVTGPFRFATLERVAPAELRLLQPHTLARLAVFLMSNYRNSKLRDKPFVLIVPREPGRETVYILGTTSLEQGETHRNVFGQAFHVAQEQTRARLQHAGFDTSLVEVAREDALRFMECLQLSAYPQSELHLSSQGPAGVPKAEEGQPTVPQGEIPTAGEGIEGALAALDEADARPTPKPAVVVAVGGEEEAAAGAAAGADPSREGEAEVGEEEEGDDDVGEDVPDEEEGAGGEADDIVAAEGEEEAEGAEEEETEERNPFADDEAEEASDGEVAKEDAAATAAAQAEEMAPEHGQEE